MSFHRPVDNIHIEGLASQTSDIDQHKKQYTIDMKMTFIWYNANNSFDMYNVSFLCIYTC